MLTNEYSDWFQIIVCFFYKTVFVQIACWKASLLHFVWFLLTSFNIDTAYWIHGCYVSVSISGFLTKTLTLLYFTFCTPSNERSGYEVFCYVFVAVLQRNKRSFCQLRVILVCGIYHRPGGECTTYWSYLPISYTANVNLSMSQYSPSITLDKLLQLSALPTPSLSEILLSKLQHVGWVFLCFHICLYN